MTYVAMTQRALNSVTRLPQVVDFGNKEVYIGGTETISKYRRKGLMVYTRLESFQFLRKRGIMTSRSAVNTSNIASQGAQAKVGARIYASARYLKVLWWESWKEKRIDEAREH